MGKAILALLLVSVVLSGIPMIEVHSHENAEFGHSHDDHDFYDDHGADQRDTEDSDTDTASLHAHNVHATSASLIASVSIEFAASKRSHSHTPLPYSWVPDNIIAPLYRPPIA